MTTDRTGQRLLISGGLLAFVMLGWTGLLMPSLIRDIQRDLVLDDGAMGFAFGVFTTAFLVGCLVTGTAVSRTGRRPLLLTALGLMVLGSVAVLLPSWPVFLAAAAARGLGSGMLEVGIQGLFLVAFAGASQGRAINSVHFAYSVGATIAPLAMAGALALGLAWTGAIALSAVPIAVAAVLLALAPITEHPGRTRADADAKPPRLAITVPLIVGATALAVYVAAEVGVSSWLVRFLAGADLALAATALTLFWVALAASRLVAARFGHRASPERVAVAGFLAAAAALGGAVVAPSVALSIALFAATGFALGPVYPAVILLGGRIAPHHTDAVTSVLASTGVVGAVLYPPLMGAISLGAGLGVAMAGAAALCVAGAALVVVAARRLNAAFVPATG